MLLGWLLPELVEVFVATHLFTNDSGVVGVVLKREVATLFYAVLCQAGEGVTHLCSVRPFGYKVVAHLDCVCVRRVGEVAQGFSVFV